MHRTWNWKMIILKCLVITLGVFLAGLGCASYLKAALGSDPVTAFVEGLGKTLGITAGAATNILNVSAFVILLLCNRKLIHIGTAIYTLFLGMFVGACGKGLDVLLGPSPALWARVVVLAVGTLAIGFGLGLYQSAELGAGPTDGLNQTVVQKTGLAYKWERIIFDALMAFIGWLLGGTIFLGTIVGVFAVGPIMAPTIQWGKRRFARLENIQQKNG